MNLHKDHTKGQPLKYSCAILAPKSGNLRGKTNIMNKFLSF